MTSSLGAVRYLRISGKVMGILLVASLMAACRDTGGKEHARRETGPASERIAAASVAWMQYSEDGLQLRIVASANRCPQVLLNGSPMEPAERELVDPAFPAASCTVPVVPGDVVEFGSRRFEVPGSIERIVVLADPACGVTRCELDSFAGLAQIAAGTDPSLVVMAGDLVANSEICYSEPGCEPPTADRWATWKLRFFDPGAPLLNSGPIVFVRGPAHACTGDKYEGWGHLVAPGWYPASVMCRPVDPTIEVDLDEQTRLFAVDATAVVPSRDLPAWLVTGSATLPGDVDFEDFRARLWIRTAPSSGYNENRGDGVAELLVGPATGPQASFWLLDRQDGCWRAERYDSNGPTGDRSECLPE